MVIFSFPRIAQNAVHHRHQRKKKNDRLRDLTHPNPPFPEGKGGKKMAVPLFQGLEIEIKRKFLLDFIFPKNRSVGKRHSYPSLSRL